MKWMLGVVVVFSLITLFELYKEYRQGHFPKKTYIIIGIMEAVVAIGSLILLFAL